MKEFREVAGEALEEARDKFQRVWIRSDLHMEAVNFALGLYTGIVMRRMRGDPDPQIHPGSDAKPDSSTAGR